MLSFLFTRSVRDRATERGLVAVPSTDRHLHSRPLPRLGGVAILASFLATVFGGLLLLWIDGRFDGEFAWRGVLTIILPALLVFLLGVWPATLGRPHIEQRDVLEPAMPVTPVEV